MDNPLPGNKSADKNFPKQIAATREKVSEFVEKNPEHLAVRVLTKSNDFINDSPPHRLILTMMAITLLVFWFWCAFTKIDQQVQGQGSIVPSGQAKVIQHLEGGIVSSIMVEEGEQVEVNQPLFRVSNQQAESDSHELQLQLISTQLQIRRLEAERDGVSAPNFKEFTTQAPPEVIDNETRLFNARTQNFKDNLNILEDQVHQKQLKLEDLENQFQNLTSELKVATEQYAINKRLIEVGAISESRYLQSQSTRQDFLTRTGIVEKTIPVIRAELNEVQSRISELQQKHQSDVLDDLKKANLSLAQFSERIKTPDDKIRRTTVTSPIRGIVNKLYITTVGGVVKPGDRLVEIVPLDDKLIVEARISTKDRGLVWEGCPALVKISAYDYAIYGGIKGKVTEISPDTLSDERGNPYYRVRVSLTQTKIGDNMPLFPGMTADINILSGKVTILHYLLRPLWKISENALTEAM